jgi:phosphoribosylanthranilate isomerase
MPRTRIKICGIRDADAARAAFECGADAIGFMFVMSSARYVEPDEAWEIVGTLPPFASTVGVFANPTIDIFCDIEEACPTTLAQFHGQEEIPIVRQCGPGLIKGIRYDEATIAAELDKWDGIDEVDAILIDGSVGGLGESFEWGKLAPRLPEVRKPILLAGGLTPENVGEAIRVVRPYAVDVSSGVERERGVKDSGLISAFCDAVRRADAR